LGEYVTEVVLSEEQKNVVRRYVQTWRRWRRGIRGFARLEEDLERRAEVLVDGIAVDDRVDGPVIRGDVKDSSFHAAIFGDDDRAVPDMTSEELAQARRYIIEGKGEIPVRKWRDARRALDQGIGAGAMARFPATTSTR
jgi:hypothetical protein